MSSKMACVSFDVVTGGVYEQISKQVIKIFSPKFRDMVISNFKTLHLIV